MRVTVDHWGGWAEIQGTWSLLASLSHCTLPQQSTSALLFAQENQPVFVHLSVETNCNWWSDNFWFPGACGEKWKALKLASSSRLPLRNAQVESLVARILLGSELPQPKVAVPRRKGCLCLDLYFMPLLELERQGNRRPLSKPAGGDDLWNSRIQAQTHGLNPQAKPFAIIFGNIAEK